MAEYLNLIYKNQQLRYYARSILTEKLLFCKDFEFKRLPDDTTMFCKGVSLISLSELKKIL